MSAASLQGNHFRPPLSAKEPKLISPRAGGLPSADQGESYEEHRGGEACCQEVGATEPEWEGGGEHEDRAQGLAEAQNGAVERDKGAAVLVGGGLVEEREGVGQVEGLRDTEEHRRHEEQPYGRHEGY